jgi:agmatinase
LEFLDLPQTDPGEADVLVLSYPFEGTVTYGKGTGNGPAAILSASLQLESYDEELDLELAERLHVAALPALEVRRDEDADRYIERVRDHVRSLELQGRFPLSFGGEHSITGGILAGLPLDPRNLTIVQIDAHADLRQSYEGTIHNHACAMRRALDLGVRKLFSIGIRSATADEAKLVREDRRIFRCWDFELAERWEALLTALRALTGPVYVTIDVDGLEPTLCPGTGTPQPGGLSWRQATAVLRAAILDSSAQIVGADVMETVPQPHSRVNELVAAKLGAKILAYREARRRG